MNKEDDDRLEIHINPGEDKTAGEAILFLIGGCWWFIRTTFWGFMVVTFAPIMGSIVPDHVAEKILAGCLDGGFRLLKEARDKGYIDEECYEKNRNHFG